MRDSTIPFRVRTGALLALLVALVCGPALSGGSSAHGKWSPGPARVAAVELAKAAGVPLHVARQMVKAVRRDLSIKTGDGAIRTLARDPLLYGFLSREFDARLYNSAGTRAAPVSHAEMGNIGYKSGGRLADALRRIAPGAASAGERVLARYDRVRDVPAQPEPPQGATVPRSLEDALQRHLTRRRGGVPFQDVAQ